MLRGRSVTGIALGLVVVNLIACAPRRPAPPPGPPPLPPLRVAVPQDTPPYAFSRERQLVGLEVDFARELAASLHRPLELVEVEWGDVLQSLLGGNTDVIMAGMTITPARQVAIAFSDPYLRSGLLAVVRREDAGRYRTPNAAFATRGAIGVVSGTTGERFVREQVPRAEINVYPTAPAAMLELRQRRVDVVVHDAPVGIWFVSRDEANLAAVLKLLDEEQLGWGMRRDDGALRAEVNATLARWRTDGTRERILARWLPYWQRLEGARPAP